MSKECKRAKEVLIDIFYQEKQMDEEIEMHLKSCWECNSYWESLHDLRDEFSVPDIGVSVDVQEEIRQAFQIAELQQKVRKERIDFAIFLLVVLAIMSFVVGIAAMGYGMAVIIGQLSFAALTSLLVPLLFIRKLRREDA